jgi:RNA polymerase primary sigma factor
MKKPYLSNSDEIQEYISDLKKIPVISHARQEEIFLELRNKKITKERQKQLFDELVVGNLRFVISVAKMYQSQGMSLSDVISEGNIGLIKAAERFDPTSGHKFISYAVWWVKQSIMQSLNENSRTIRIPSNLVQDAQKEKKVEIDDQDNFRSELPSEEADEKPIAATLPYCIGLYRQINEDGDQLIDVIPNKNAENPEDILNTPEEIKKKVAVMLSILDEREKIIIERYYGLTGIESNLEDLGEEFGCTKERIRQLRDKAIKKLRNESFGLLNYL